MNSPGLRVTKISKKLEPKVLSGQQKEYGMESKLFALTKALVVLFCVYSAEYVLAQPKPTAEANAITLTKEQPNGSNSTKPSISDPANSAELSKFNLELKRIAQTKALLIEQVSELELRKRIATLNNEISTLQTPKMPLGSVGGPLPSGPVPGASLTATDQGFARSAEPKTTSSNANAPAVITDIIGIDGKNAATAVLPGGKSTTIMLGSKIGAWTVTAIDATGVSVQSGSKTLHLTPVN